MREYSNQRLAVDVHGLAASNKKKVCCICGKEYEGFGNNPAPYKNKGRCCDKCDRDYVLPSRMYLTILGTNLTDKEVKKELTKFRNRYLVFPYNFNEKLILEIGEQVIKCIEMVGEFNTTYMMTDTIFDGHIVPIGTMSKSETIECMEKYLSTIDKTLDSWIEETGYKLYWNKKLYCVAESERMKKTGSSSDSTFIEPLIENDADAIERMAESALIEN